MANHIEEEHYFKTIRIAKNESFLPQPNYDEYFDFSAISYSAYIRFIQLLKLEAIHFFRKTSKQIYQQCLDLRGIAVSYLVAFDSSSWGAAHGHLQRACGKIILRLSKIRPTWIEYLKPDILIADKTFEVGQLCVKRYTTLVSHWSVAKNGVHPGLKSFLFHGRLLDIETLLECLSGLDVCKDLRQIHICTHSKAQVTNFDDWKKALEQCYQRHKRSLSFCSIKLRTLEFTIHQDVLCYSPETGQYVKDYNFYQLFAEQQHLLI